MVKQSSFLTAVLLLCSWSLSAAETSLSDIYALALEADPRIKIARYQVDVGQAQYDTASGTLLPQATFSVNFSSNHVDYEGGGNQSYEGEKYSLQVRQALFNWQAISGKARAMQVVEQREVELMDMMSTLLVDVAERYFKVLLADDDLNLSRAEEELVEQQLRQTEELYKRKLVNVTDYLETQARADQVRTGLIEAENNAALAREGLFELTGVDVETIASLKEGFVLPRFEHDMAHWTEQALAGSPFLLAKKAAVLSAKGAIEEQTGRHYPTVDLVLSLQRSDVGYDNQSSPQRDTGYVGVDLNVPLYSGGSTSARVREARSQYYILLQEEEAARRDLLKRTREAWLNTRASRRWIDSAALGVDSATKAYEAMSKSFSYGTVTAADVLEALHGKTRAQRDYQEALYSYLTNWLSLKRASGQLQAEDLYQLNDSLIGVSRP